MPDIVDVQVPDSITSLQRVSIRCPLFNSERPALWFAQLEGQFHLAGISDEITQYHYASLHLDAMAAAEVEDLLLNVPTETSYTRLKGTLVERLTLFREARLQQLLERGTLDMDIDKLASLADKIHDIALPATQINSVQEPAATSAVEPRISRLEASINELASSFKRQVISRSRSRHRFRLRTSSPAPNNNTCWYRQNFGNKAKRCRSPCTFQGNLPLDHRATKIKFLVDIGAYLCKESLAPWSPEQVNFKTCSRQPQKC
ncbi:uncharacterized protein [Bactrocera oleae]|uniref:uncharacterized protein n=1 Tax=Bactrocera oleae TaxID=104688 RepID=UPI00387E29E5